VSIKRPGKVHIGLIFCVVIIFLGCGGNTNKETDTAVGADDSGGGDGGGTDTAVGSGDGGADDGGGGDTDFHPTFHRVVVVGDHHGDYKQALKSLMIGGVIDEQGRWIGGDTYLVQLGDILDRGDEEREIIDYYEEIKPQAKAAGGLVVNLNGNHEIMTAYADYRYMTPGSCEAFADLEGLDTTRPEFAELLADCKIRAGAFWPGGPYARIIAEWPMILQLQGSLFVHGGILPDNLAYGVDEINEMARAWLLGKGPRNSSMVGGGDGAVDWDRTFSSTSEPPTQEDCLVLDNMLTQLGATRLIVGHSVQSTINSGCNGAVWRVDVGMAAHYGGKVEVLQIENEQMTVLFDLSD
jgi:Calcineurin-like phosphoesterase